MRQIFLLILLVAIGQWFFKALRRAQSRSGSPGQGAQSAPNDAGGPRRASGSPPDVARGPQAALPEPMIRCAQCGVHAPRSESVLAGTRSFCSYEHLRAWTAQSAAGQDRAAR